VNLGGIATLKSECRLVERERTCNEVHGSRFCTVGLANQYQVRSIISVDLPHTYWYCLLPQRSRGRLSCQAPKKGLPATHLPLQEISSLPLLTGEHRLSPLRTPRFRGEGGVAPVYPSHNLAHSGSDQPAATQMRHDAIASAINRCCTPLFFHAQMRAPMPSHAAAATPAIKRSDPHSTFAALHCDAFGVWRDGGSNADDPPNDLPCLDHAPM
jgi:hypothetical protein